MDLHAPLQQRPHDPPQRPSSHPSIKSEGSRRIQNLTALSPIPSPDCPARTVQLPWMWGGVTIVKLTVGTIDRTVRLWIGLQSGPTVMHRLNRWLKGCFGQDGGHLLDTG